MWKCQHCFESPHVVVNNKTSELKALCCQRCERDSVEIVNHRVTSKVCSARVFEVESFKATRGNKPSYLSTLKLKLYGELLIFAQSQINKNLCTLLDHLCQDLNLGHEYIVIGVFEPFKNFYNVWNILPATAN